MICGYVLPAIWTLVMIIVELASPRCARYKPNFGEEACFFTDYVAKGIWFYLPMGVALIINSIAFGSVAVVLYQHHKLKQGLKDLVDSNKPQSNITEEM